MRNSRTSLVGSIAALGAIVFVAGCWARDPNALTNDYGTDDDLEVSDELRKRPCKGNPNLPCDAGADADAQSVVDAGAAVDASTVVDASVPPPPPPAPETCTSFTYSAFGACQPTSTQTRTVVSALPAGCTGGAPVLSQACVYTPPPPPPISFANQVQPIFTASCVGCHDGGLSPNLSAGVSYGSLVNVNGTFCSTAKLVVPSQPAQSWLLSKVTLSSSIGTCSGGSMAKYISAADRTTIATWIQQGAPNN